jgi:hypothetical protein
MNEFNHEIPTASVADLPSAKNAAVENRQRHLDRRSQRLEELTIEALEEPSALRANLKAATAQLLDIGYRLGDAIQSGVGADPAKPTGNREETGAIQTYMLVHRQITRYIQLERQWASE